MAKLSTKAITMVEYSFIVARLKLFLLRWDAGKPPLHCVLEEDAREAKAISWG